MSIFSLQSFNTGRYPTSNPNPKPEGNTLKNPSYPLFGWYATWPVSDESSAYTSVDVNLDTYSNSSSTLKPPTVAFTEEEIKKSTGYPLYSNFSKQLGVKEVQLSNGVVINETCLTRYEGMQKEMLDLFRYMDIAAKELGLTFTVSEISRTVETSNSAHANKSSSLVAQGGKSPHNYGAACDITLFCNGKTVSSTSVIQKKFADRVLELSKDKETGKPTIVWGGYYTRDCNGPDLPGTGEEHHFEIRGWENKYKKPEYLITKLSY